MFDFDTARAWASGQSASTLIALTIAGPLTVYNLGLFAYRLFLSPLRSIPGPWYAAISDFWLITHTLRLRKCRAIQELFLKYGPVVRTGPNTVLFMDVPAMKTVYGSASKFDKDPWYKSLLTNENDHAMTTLPCGPYIARRRGYSPHYVPGNLAGYQPEMHDFTLELAQRLDDIAGKVPFDCLALFRYLMVDVILCSSFGITVNAVRAWAADREDPMSTAINDFPKRGLIRGAVPPWLWNLLIKIPIPRWRKLCDSDAIIARYVKERVTEMRDQINEGKIGEAEKTPLLYRLLQHKIDGEPMRERDIISECMGHQIAGVDTTSTSASYFCWELSRRPDICDKLREELDNAMPDPRNIPDIQALQKLPYLNAFIKEGLRLYGVAPSPLPRVVPSSGLNVLGYDVPEGTTVATQSWSMHRRKEIFGDDVDVFRPERWLEATDEMNAHMMPFGHGMRICGGQNVANIMLRIIIATVVRNFELRAPKETNEKTMYMCDSFVIFPAAMECKLFFVPRKH